MLHPLGLAPNVFACECDGLIIFLDLKGDRYLALNAQQSLWYKALADKIDAISSPGHSSQLAGRLQEKGLLAPVTSGRGLLLAPPIPPPKDSISSKHFSFQRAQAIESGKIAWAIFRAWYSGRTRSILQIVDANRKTMRQILADWDPTEEDVCWHTLAFQRLAPLFFSVEGACRFHSIALLKYLIAARIPADWVFGVRLSPFAAHCWVEWNSTVLNDDIDHVREFHPILKV